MGNAGFISSTALYGIVSVRCSVIPSPLLKTRWNDPKQAKVDPLLLGVLRDLLFGCCVTCSWAFGVVVGLKP